MASNPNDIPIEVMEEKTLFHGRWLGARQIIYKHRGTDQSAQDARTDLSKLPMWQVAYRTTKPENANVDGVAVIATLIKTMSSSTDGSKKEKFLVLVKQFRVPLMKYCIEFPAGLLDPKETATEAGIRELKEETGYTATKVLGATEGVQALDPGISDDSMNFVLAEIDGDLEANREQMVKQNLDDDERIEVVLIPFDGLLQKLKEYVKQGVQIEAMVYAFAFGTVFKNGQASQGFVV